MSWFQIWTLCWQVAIVLTPLIVASAGLWLYARFQSKIDAVDERNSIDAALATARAVADQRHETVRDKFNEHDTRVTALEDYKAQPPSQHKVANAISIVQAEVREVTKEVAGLVRLINEGTSNQNRQFDTLNSYLHTLVERGLAK